MSHIVLELNRLVTENISKRFQQMLDDNNNLEDRNTKMDAYYFLLVRIVNRFLFNPLVLVSRTIFVCSGILVFIYFYWTEFN
jgi:hypothetical protein